MVNLKRIPTPWMLFFLTAVVIGLYSPALTYEFINLDDYTAVVHNPEIKKGFTKESIAWAFTTSYYDYWHPLTWITHIADWSLYGPDPTGHHLTNILFHAGSTLLLFLVIQLLLKSRFTAFWGALLFGIHPMSLESVVWIVERKDVMSLFFGLLSIAAYLRYTDSGLKKHYFFSVTAYILGLMAKPILVSFPFVLMLIDATQFNPANKKIGRFIRERLFDKIPFLILGFSASLATYAIVKSINSISSFDAIPLNFRILNAMFSYYLFLLNFILPLKTSIFHPYNFNITFSSVILPTFICISLLIIAAARFKKNPFALAGTLWFFGTFVPMIGIIQTGSQAYADRFAYLPYIGLIVALAGEVKLIPRSRIRYLVFLPLIVLAALHHYQIGFWKNTETLFKRSLALNPDGVLIPNNLGVYYLGKDMLDSSEIYFLHAVKNDPFYTTGILNLGVIETKRGNYAKANTIFRKVLEIDSLFTRAYISLADNYARMNQNDSLLQILPKIQSLFNPENSSYLEWFDMGKVYDYLNYPDSAIQYYIKSITINPDQWNVYNNLGAIYYAKKNDSLAMSYYYKAIEYSSTSPEPWHNILLVTLKNRQYKETVDIANHALSLFPDDVRFFYSRATAYGKMGMNDKMKLDLEMIQKINPSSKLKVTTGNNDLEKEEPVINR